MEAEVTELTYSYPDRAARAAAAQPMRKKPAARITATLAGGASRELFVPTRVARAFEAAAPELPLPYTTLRELVFAKEDAICYAVLVDMLARRDHAEAEARRKLELAGYRAASIDMALSRAREARFLNDERFAVSFIEERLQRGWGRRKIERELSARGVALDAVPGYPDAFFSDESDVERAQAVLARKRVPEERAFEKLVRHLMGKGFSYSVASQAARWRIDGMGDA